MEVERASLGRAARLDGGAECRPRHTAETRSASAGVSRDDKAVPREVTHPGLAPSSAQRVVGLKGEASGSSRGQRV